MTQRHDAKGCREFSAERAEGQSFVSRPGVGWVSAGEKLESHREGRITFVPSQSRSEIGEEFFAASQIDVTNVAQDKQ